MRLHHTAMTLMVAGVLSLITTPVPADAQRGESDSERAYTVEGISCALFPEDCQPAGRTRGVPQRPSERPPAEPGKPNTVVFKIRFATNSAEIPAKYYADLDQLGQALVKSLPGNPRAQVEIAGHTDSVGSQSSNQKLSERRAASVKRYLMNKFNIASENLSVKGYGSSQLAVTPDNTPEAREQNRRVVAERK